MFTTARRHGIPLPSPTSKHDRDRQKVFHQSSHHDQQLHLHSKDKPPALSAPSTPSNGHTHAQAYAAAAAAAAVAARPATATAASASFSRATGRTLAHPAAHGPHARPLTAGATHLPPSVPQTFPTPAPSPSPSPLSGQTSLRLAMPRTSASACATPSPLSSGLPSPTLPPLPPSYLPAQSQVQPQSHMHPIAITSSHVRSPVINIGTSASPLSHHTRKLSKDEFDYRLARRPSHGHSRQISLSNKSASGSSPNSPSDRSSRGSSGSVREDVLAPGECVGEGLALQGEVLRRVFNEVEGPMCDKEEPAAELEVVRRLGAGSYAVVYLVREILRRLPPPGILDGLDGSRQDCNSTSGQDSETFDELDLWDSSVDMDMDMDGLELDGMRRKKRNSIDGDVSEEGREKVHYGKEYAVKVLSKAGMDDEALEAQLVEANIHQSLPTHSNIVTLHRALETPSFLLLVLEFVPGEDLYYFLEQARDHYEPGHPSSGSASSDDSDAVDRGHTANVSVVSVNTIGTMNTTRTPPTPSLLSTLNEKQLLGRKRLRLIASMFAQMCEAVAVCHDVGVYHRDIKPENFIVTDGWDEEGERRVVVVKLTDFGLSTRDAASSDMDCGSAPYMSYECRNNCAPYYSPRASDVWSLGIVLINMLYHVNPWTDTTSGVCPSFSAFYDNPEHFMTQRFAGMVPAVASFLCERVFCILPSDDPSDREGRRASAREFGRWARELPRLMASEEPVGVPPAVKFPESSPALARNALISLKDEKDQEVLVSPTSPSSTLLAQSLAAVLAQQEAAAAAGSSSPAWRHKRGLSNASIGYALSSVPQSRRPASRQQSFSAERAPHLGLSGLSGISAGASGGLGSAAGSRAATPLLRGRALGSAGPRSRVPSGCETPAGILGVGELPTVFDEGEGDLSCGSLGLELGFGSERVREKEGDLEVEQHREHLNENEQDQEPEHEHEHEHEHDGEEDAMSRSTSMVRRRKRGARRGKGQIIQQQQMEIARLQQKQDELARKVLEMQEQLQSQKQQSPTQTQIQVLSSLNPVVQTSAVPHIQTSTNQSGANDPLDSLASASEALARELSRTRNARGSSAVFSSSPLSHTHTHAIQLPLPNGQQQVASVSHSHSSQVAHSVPLSASSAGSNLDDNESPISRPASTHASDVGMRDGPSLIPAKASPTSQVSAAAATALTGVGGPTPDAMIFMSLATPARAGSTDSGARGSQQSSSSSLKVSTAQDTQVVVAPIAPAPAIAKKTSKWKLSFGKGSSSAHSRAPIPPLPQPVETIDITADAAVNVNKEDGADARQSDAGSAQHGASPTLSCTATRVKDVLMSLDADMSTGMGAKQASPSMVAGGANGNEPWSRGRRPAGGQQAWSPPLSSTDRWPNVDRERNVSPNSTRTGRSGNLSTLSSSASSVSHSSGSNNWRHSTLTTSSAASGWTRYSNGSVRSVSTVATSVSGASGTGSWRNGNASNASLASAERKAGYHTGGTPSLASRSSDKSGLSGMPPPNVKIMTGVPWALDELPRQLHPNPNGDIFGMPPSGAPRKQRTRKPKDLPTINERPSPSSQFFNSNMVSSSSNSNSSSNFNSKAPVSKSPLSQRADAGRSSSSLNRYSHGGTSEDVHEEGGGDDVKGRTDGTPRKVQKGQINALAKMLSALKR